MKLCWHKWTLWGDVFHAGNYLRQSRYCTKCRKAQMRIV